MGGNDGSVALRKASGSDLAAVRAIATIAYAPYVGRIGRPPTPMVADFSLSIDGNVVTVAEVGDGKVVGYVVAYPVNDFWHLENIAVHPRWHGRGIGRMLIADVEARARAAGARNVDLYTNQTMTENQMFYRRLGYVETGRGEEAGFNRVYFRKDL